MTVAEILKVSYYGLTVIECVDEHDEVKIIAESNQAGSFTGKNKDAQQKVLDCEVIGIYPTCDDITELHIEIRNEVT